MFAKIKLIIQYWLPLIIYCLLIYIQSDHPSPSFVPSFKFSDKLLHFAAYGVMGILFYRAYQTLPFKNNTQLLTLLSIISASLYGISDEIHQSFVPYRSAQLSDAFVDTLGSICGVWFYHWWLGVRADRWQRTDDGGQMSEDR